MLDSKWNFFGPTSAGHKAEAYKNLPHGWRSRPDGIWSDLYMWRQWLEQAKCRFYSVPIPTTLALPSPYRVRWSEEQRVEEQRLWFMRSREPGFRAWLERKHGEQWQNLNLPLGEHIDLAAILMKHGELFRAEHLLRKAMSVSQKVPSLYIQLSELLRQKGQMTEARDMALTACELWPENAVMHFRASVFLFQTGDKTRASSYCKKAIELDPMADRFHTHLALCHDQTGS